MISAKDWILCHAKIETVRTLITHYSTLHDSQVILDLSACCIIYTMLQLHRHAQQIGSGLELHNGEVAVEEEKKLIGES